MPYYRLFYHFIWATKNRLPLIVPANRELIFATITTKVEELRGVIYALNAMEDHVHLVVSVPPSVSPAELIGQVKGGSSHTAARLIHAAGHSFAWQHEYGVSSVSERHLPVVIRYVQEQQQRHAEGMLSEILESCASS